MEEVLIFLDAQTENFKQRITCFSDCLEDLMSDYKDWMEENKLTQKDIWYADVFDVNTDKHLLCLEEENGNIYAVGAPKNSRINPFKRRMGLRRRLRLWLTYGLDWLG